ncbi:MAG: FAD-binding oxidoreductase [Sedimentisphaerales bacterium]|jgi:FAD/FMN-containing dehydrogenase|nr:FAD-binding oxidoreductase [Sedimentisphaerales bacterium]HNY76879.1 FAD-binding oxidoreductase [Sedimentisphaerales bacterium]HOC62733.1 FAD-binding oxidoreductase [Sedimentisphaerales bacterium]HOH62653.1 FAD-binding oxidoreductase [Sedimentisphaerales bacterium]HQA90248.1 FAD-binding oxidoreductase [Sedimentisphaerales bacterium]
MRTRRVETRAESTTLSDEAIQELCAALRGDVITAGDQAFDEARRVWNGLIDKRPALIARCAEAADVIAAVNFARGYGVPLSVRGGGHNVAGKALCDEGLVIDLSDMRGVHVDPATRVVRAEGGALLGDIDRRTQMFGLAVPLGVVSQTGVAGLCLHGGMGWLTRKHGLTLDNLIGVDIVTADGRLRRASATENPDLFWAVRGGGGNFGVVTSFEFRAHPIGPRVWFLAAMYPMPEATRILRFLEEFMREAPEELAVLGSLWTTPNDEPIPPEHRREPVIVLLGCYSGPFEKGEEAIRPLRELGEPVADLSGPMPFADVQTALDADYPDGRLYYWKSVYLPQFGEEIIDVLVEHAQKRPSPLTSIDIWFLAGAAMRVRPDQTAYARRDVPYAIGIESNWTDPAQSEDNVAWVRRLFDALRPFSRGTYLNFPGFMEDADKLLQGAYGANYKRLQAIKARYDPDNLFKGALNIPPKA